MKTFLIFAPAALACLALTSQSPAYAAKGGGDGYENAPVTSSTGEDSSGCPEVYYYDQYGNQVGGAGGCPLDCAPKDSQNNLQTADLVFSDLASNELKDAPTFKEKAAAIAAMPVSKAKSDAYFKLAGLTKPSAFDILKFLFARNPDQKTVKAVMDNLALDTNQAKLVITRMTTALKPR